MIEMKITEEDIARAEREIELAVFSLKPSWRKKTTKELLKIFTEQAHMHEYMCVSGSDDVEYAVSLEILFERGFEKEVQEIIKDAIKTGKACLEWQMKESDKNVQKKIF